MVKEFLEHQPCRKGGPLPTDSSIVTVLLVTLGMGGKEKQKLRERLMIGMGLTEKVGEEMCTERMAGGKAGEVRQPWFKVAEQREVKRYSHLTNGIPRSWEARGHHT